MRKKGISALLWLILLSIPFAQIWADLRTRSIESVIIDSFDGAGSAQYPPRSEIGLENTRIDGQPVVWTVKASSFSHEGYPQQNYFNAWPFDLMGPNPENSDSLQVLGLRCKFDRIGYNVIEIIPGSELGGEWIAGDYLLPGQVESLNLWVWGSGFRYNLEAVFRDYRGRVIILPMIQADDPSRRDIGSLQFPGWKKMYVNIPGNIPQANSYTTEATNLRFVKFVIRTHPEERVDDFIVYFDEMRVITDNHDSFFDGIDLADPQTIDDMWGGPAAPANNNANPAANENAEPATP